MTLEIHMTVGERIVAARCKAEMSQDELAAAAGVHRQTISDIERGATRRPTLPVLLKLAAALNLPVELLTLGRQREYKQARDRASAAPDHGLDFLGV